VDWLSFPCSVRTLRSKLEFRELGLDRASTTAIPISNTGIIPAGGITTSNPTMGTTEDRHTIRIRGIECIPVTTVIICIKPRWAQSARFDEIVFACLCLNVAAKAGVAEMSTPRFVILIVCFASIALADDFKTINGKEYKNATVTRVEHPIMLGEMPNRLFLTWSQMPPKNQQDG